MLQSAIEPTITVFKRLKTRASDNTIIRLALRDHIEQNISSELYISFVFY
jgi:hypothetical protein